MIRLEEMFRPTRPGVLALILVATSAILWFGLGLRRISDPGLYYDEVIFVNVALGAHSGEFARDRLLGVPMFIMPYIGSLKSFLYWPIFHAFGVNAWTIRAPTLIISFFTILLGWRLVGSLAGSRAASMALLLMSLDPALIWSSRTDFGPTCLASFFILLSLVLFFRWIQGGNRSSFLFLLLALGLGFWNKLNFIWFILALGAAGFVIYPRRSLELLRRGGFLLWVISGIWALFFGLFLFLRVFPLLRSSPMAEGAPTGIARLAWFSTLFSMTFDGSSLANFQFPHSSFPRGGTVWFFFGALFFALAAFFLRHFRGSRDEGVSRKDDPAGKAPLFFLLVFFIVAFQIWITPQAGGLHHFMMLYPLPFLIGFSAFGRTIPCMPRKISLVFGLVGVGLYLGWTFVEVRADLAYSGLLRRVEEQSPKWSSSIYELSRRLESEPLDAVICGDWGLWAQLYALARPGNRHRYVEFWPLFKGMRRNPEKGKWLKKRFAGKRIALVLHAPPFTEQHPCCDEAIAWFARSVSRKAETWVLPHTDGRPLYEVHRGRIQD